MMDTLDAILSKPPQDRDAIENMLLQHDYPDEARKAAEKYAQLQAIATAAREYFHKTKGLADFAHIEYEELEAALAALEQETK